ncbi:MAG: ISNCY family transposase [Thermodesulfobacteriota bacterium]
MAGKDIIYMSLRELKRLKVIHEAIESHITQKKAAFMTGLSERQVRRLVSAVRAAGERGVVHKGRGMPSNRRMSEKIKEKVLKLYRKKYPGFGPLLATEKLKELDGISLSDETLRKWLMEAGLWKKRRKRSSHRRWRVRKECCGEMVQMDGSHHDWLEGRGPKLVLMGYIDDATGNVFGRFYDYEGTAPAMESFKGYVKRYGLPQSVYLDRHSTYKSTKRLTAEEELRGQSSPMSQFERALEELGVEVIHANSPQAKGRVERLFGTLQDRLVKEMRLQEIKTKEEANGFLKEYLPVYNRRFRVSPANETDVHVRLPRYFNMDRYLCMKTERTVRNDNTVAHNGKLYQIEEKVKTRKVTVEERVDGSLHIMTDSAGLKCKEIRERPKSEAVAKSAKTRKPYTPPKDHPWRRWQSRRSLPSKGPNGIQLCLQ